MAPEDEERSGLFLALEVLWRDARHSLRGLRRNPGFTLLAVLLLALGIGVATAVFTVYDVAVLQAISVRQPESLVLLRAVRRGSDYVIFNPVFEALREEQRTLSAMFAISEDPFLKVRFEGERGLTYLRGSMVSGDYFPALGVSPAIGRLLSTDDDRPVGADVSHGCAAVVSHSLWKRRFEGSPFVIGRPLEARGFNCTIVGVTEESFRGHQPGSTPEVWLPLRAVTAPRLLASQSMAFFAGVMGRLRPGVSRKQAEADLNTLFQRIEVTRPRSPSDPEPQAADYRLRVIGGAQGLSGIRRELGEPLGLVLGVAVTVLVIATINVSSLLLARGRGARARELATRRVLGARRLDLVRQLGIEGTLLAVTGGLLGFWLARTVSRQLLGWMVFRDTPVTLDFRPDYWVMGIAVGAMCLVVVVTTLVVALPLSRSALPVALAEHGRTVVRRTRYLEGGLVALQLALSLMLVTAAGLMLRTVVKLSRIDPGFVAENVVSLEVRDERPNAAPAHLLAQRAERSASYRAIERTLGSLPGVQSVSLSWLGLFGGSDQWVGVIDPQRPEDQSEVRVDQVTSRYLETVGMRIVRGRDFTEHDDETAPRVAIVNEALVKARFDGGEALGRRLAFKFPPGETDKPYTVVGVVRDSKYKDLREAKIGPMVWVPLLQSMSPPTAINVRVQPGAEDSVMRQAPQLLAAIDPCVMVRRVTTLSKRLDQTIRRELLLLRLASAFSVVALLLAAIGVYATIAHQVTERTREIGVRLALGAAPRRVRFMVVVDAFKLVALGLVAGLPLAMAAGSALRAFVFGVPAQDLVTLAASVIVLTVAALAAGYFPARRASRIDPNVALRYE